MNDSVAIPSTPAVFIDDLKSGIILFLILLTLNGITGPTFYTSFELEGRI